MKYHKIFKMNSDFSIYLFNPKLLEDYNEQLLERLTGSLDTEKLHEAKCSILKDFRDIYNFDINDAQFPEPTGHFDSEKKKTDFIRKKILLQDIVRYLGTVYKKYHTFIYQKNNTLPEIQLKKLAIDYNEIYRKAMDDYIEAIASGKPHAITASFVLPSLIEQSLVMNLQNRMLYKCLYKLLDNNFVWNSDSSEEEKYLSIFLQNNDSFLFNASERHVMGKMYELFVRKGVLKQSAENEMILTGMGRCGRKKITRTLGTLLNTNFAREEMLPEYYEILQDLFVRLNLRNCIMHGLGETFDYLNIGLVSIMFQLLWDIAECEVFNIRI